MIIDITEAIQRLVDIAHTYGSFTVTYDDESGDMLHEDEATGELGVIPARLITIRMVVPDILYDREKGL